MRSTVPVIGSALVLAWASSSVAQPRPKGPPLVDVSAVKTVKPTQGFIDDPFVIDSAGSRLLYVNADAGYMAEMHVLDLTQRGARLARIDISKLTTTPVSVRFLDDGYFVVSRPEGKQATAFLLDQAGQVKRTFGPADHIALTTRDGTPLVATHSVEHKEYRYRGGRRRGRIKLPGNGEFHHTVQFHTLAGKTPFGKPRVLVADDKGLVSDLDLRIAYWANGYTRVVGVKGGQWDAKEDQRSPDTEGWYDVITRTFEKRLPITNLMEHTLLMRQWANHDNEAEFLAVKKGLVGVELVTPTGRSDIALAEPFRHYDPKSLVYQPSDDGLFYFTLKIDPVHPEAVARKKADPEYLDLYEYRVGEKKARRRGRILLTSKRTMSWQASDSYWVVVPRLMGFSRGGKELTIYQLK